MFRRVTPLKRVTSPTWGPLPPCKQALSYTFLGENVARVLDHFFSLPPFALVVLAFLISSPPLLNVHVVLPTQNVSFVFYLSL